MISPQFPAGAGAETVAQAMVSGFHSTYCSTWQRTRPQGTVILTSTHTTPSQEPRTEQYLDPRQRARLDGGLVWTLSRCHRPRNKSNTTLVPMENFSALVPSTRQIPDPSSPWRSWPGVGRWRYRSSGRRWRSARPCKRRGSGRWNGPAAGRGSPPTHPCGDRRGRAWSRWGDNYSACHVS